MAKRPSKKKTTKRKGGDTNEFGIETGGELEEITRKFKSGEHGIFLRVEQDAEFTVAILQTPTEWPRWQEYSIPRGKNQWSYLPHKEKCPARRRFPDINPRMYAAIPLYVYEHKKVQYFRCPPTTFTDLATQFKKNKRSFLTKKWFMNRVDGEGAVRYAFGIMPDEKVTSKVAKSKLPDFAKGVSDRYARALEQLGIGSGNDFSESDDDDDAVFDHSSSDIDIDDIKSMDEEELLDVIDEYELDIEDPEDFNLKALRKMVIKEMKSQEDDE